jgi:proteasome beta subunit
MEEHYKEPMKGTTTVGLIFKDGVVLATDKRATMGYFIASKNAKKVYQISDRIGMTTAGGVGDAQQLVRVMTVECNLYNMRRGKSMTVGAASTLLSNILNHNRYFPYYVQLLVGGMDETGPHLFSVDAMGGATKEDDVVATGSGSPTAYGILEDRYKPGMNEEDALGLGVRAVRAAMKRDVATGEGVQAVVITKDTYREIPEEELQKKFGKILA